MQINLQYVISCTDLTDPPVSESGLLYKTVEFNCKGIGDGLVWTVANYPLNDTVKQKRNINVTTSNTSDILSSNLTIHALPINHGIEIGCIVHSLHPNYMAEAKEVKLTVKGYIGCILWFILTHSYRCIPSSKCSMAF